MKPKKILGSKEIETILNRLSFQLIEDHNSFEETVLIGIQPRGAYLSKKISKLIDSFVPQNSLKLGFLDITFFRDDFRTKLKMPDVKVTEIPFDLYERDVILIDDVLYTGRTVRSALDALMAYGRPRKIQFCCMVDRGHRELPIAPDFVGVQIPTYATEEVRVRVKELDGEDAVYLVDGDDALNENLFSKE